MGNMTFAPPNSTEFSSYCTNENCKEPPDFEKAKSEIEKNGAVYADCHDRILMGYKCPDLNCNGLGAPWVADSRYVYLGFHEPLSPEMREEFKEKIRIRKT